MLIIDMPMPKTCENCPISNFKSRPCMLRGDPRTAIEMHLAYMNEERPSWCPIKCEISEIELMSLEEERAFAARNIAAERKDDEQI